MKKMILVVSRIFVVVFILFLVQAQECFANPIDLFIGQLDVKKSVEAVGATGHNKGKLFILYHGDRVVIERNSKTGKLFLVGIYTMSLDPDFYPGIDDECIVRVERVRVKNFTLNVDINNTDIKSCF